MLGARASYEEMTRPERMRRARLTWARFYPPTASALFVAMLGVAGAFGIESWPFSSYPMYSVPKRISQVEALRFAFELDTGEVVLWKPDFPYIAKDLAGAVERSRGQPGFEATLEAAARAVLADLRHDHPIEDLSRIRRVLVLRRTVRRAEDAGRFVVEDRPLASFPVEALR